MRARGPQIAAPVVVAVLLATGGLLTACGGTSGDRPPSPSGTTAAFVAPARTEEFLPGLKADIFDSASPGPGPVVVLVPGGGWTSADPSGLAPLAMSLAAAGMTVVSVTYRTATSGTYYPGPLQDVTCAVAFAAARATPGVAPRLLVVVGHSAGANLAALAALAPQRAATCPYPAAAPDALVGLAGPYDVAAFPEGAALFGTTAAKDPRRWAAGNPLTHAASRPEVPVLLLHGKADDVVPVSFTTQFAAALKAGGHRVTVELVAGADHSAIYRSDVAAPRLVAWIDRLR
jgi:acetyl esterase/lipase